MCLALPKSRHHPNNNNPHPLPHLLQIILNKSRRSRKRKKKRKTKNRSKNHLASQKSLFLTQKACFSTLVSCTLLKWHSVRVSRGVVASSSPTIGGVM